MGVRLPDLVNRFISQTARLVTRPHTTEINATMIIYRGSMAQGDRLTLPVRRAVD